MRGRIAFTTSSTLTPAPLGKSGFTSKRLG
nr:MAG TPA: hypothetical protein [Caudoviricetes sp.]